MFSPIKAFHDGLRERRKRWSFVDLDFLKPDLYLNCLQEFLKTFFDDPFESFIIALSRLMGR